MENKVFLTSTIITLTYIFAKLFGQIKWSWAWVFSPFIILICFSVIVFIVSFLKSLIQYHILKKDHAQKKAAERKRKEEVTKWTNIKNKYKR